MPYTPSATDTTNPLDSGVLAATAAAEFRTLKTYIAGAAVLGAIAARVISGGALGTPSSGVLTNCTGLPSTSLTGLAAGISTFLTTPNSANLAAAVTDETGSGALVFANSPALGAITATSVNKLTLTAPATGSTLTIADGKTLTASNTLTLAGTDGSTITLGAGGTVAYVTNKLSVFAATSSAELAGVISDETGTGSLVFATGPALTTPNVGVATATSINKVTITAPATSATLTIADGKTLTISNSIALAGTDATTMTFPGVSSSIGYLGMPVNSQSNNYTLVLSDASKLLYNTNAGGPKTFTVPANSSVAFPVGTTLFFNFLNPGNIAVTTDTLTLAGTATTGTRSVAQNGMARMWKTTATTWVIDGTGVT